MVLTEPDVALTDFALCIMSAYFAYRLSRIKTAEPGAQRTAVAFFIALATASLLGGIVHGFFVVKGTLGNTVLWTLTMINLGVVAFLLWLIAASVMPGASMRAFKIVASALLIAYEGFILLVRRDFLVALIMASVRRVPQDVAHLKHGAWQQAGLKTASMPPNFGIGTVLKGRTLGIWSYGKVGQIVAGYGRAFGMRVIIWGSQASRERAQADGFEIRDR